MKECQHPSKTRTHSQFSTFSMMLMMHLKAPQIFTSVDRALYSIKYFPLTSGGYHKELFIFFKKIFKRL